MAPHAASAADDRLAALLSARFESDVPRDVPPTVPLELRPALLASPKLRHVECAVVGGGIGGLAFARLRARARRAKGLPADIAVVERENRFGGRVFDVDLSGGAGEHVGLGAWRVKRGDKRMLELADNYGIRLRPWSLKDVRFEARGVTATSMDGLRNMAFPEIDALYRSKPPGYSLMDDVVARVEADPVSARRHGTLANLIAAEFGPEAAEWARATYGPWTAHYYSVDAVWLVRWWRTHDWGERDELRPPGGLGEIVAGVEGECRELGVELLAGDAVVELEKFDDSPDAGSRYLLRTASGTILLCRTLVLALPPAALRLLRSDFLSRYLFPQPIFSDVVGIPAFKAALSFASRWWEPELPAPGGDGAYPCMATKTATLGLLVAHPPAGDRHVLHCAYTDDPHSLAAIVPLLHSRELVLSHLATQLALLFPHKAIPAPLDLAYAYWRDGAWHQHRPGSCFSEDAFAAWSPAPLGAGERVALVGEAWGRAREWCEGAVDSAEAAFARLG
ncbi:hypothetical protein DFJ74DRAFT_763284 [Hyaloraphidium curvatum]|nr:hypothetical protein DFJ74DRAFT_763284 [Hyaloraphidium curvatum]